MKIKYTRVTAFRDDRTVTVAEPVLKWVKDHVRYVGEVGRTSIFSWPAKDRPKSERAHGDRWLLSVELRTRFGGKEVHGFAHCVNRVAAMLWHLGVGPKKMVPGNNHEGGKPHNPRRHLVRVSSEANLP